MDISSFVKQEESDALFPNSSLCGPIAQNGTVFDTYINTDFVDENCASGAASVTLPPNEPLIPNQDYMNLLMNDLFVNMNYNNSIRQGTYIPEQSMMIPYAEPLPIELDSSEREGDHENSQKTTFTRKKSASFSISKSEGTPDSSLGRVELILSPEDLELIAKATPKEKRQIRNKISARNFRLRRKDYINGLEEKAKNYDQDTEALRKALSEVEQENTQLKYDIENIKGKFELLTTQIPELNQLSGFDPINDLAISLEGRLVIKAHNAFDSVSSPGLALHSKILSCREMSGLDVNSQNDQSQEASLGCHFSSSRDRTFLVKA